MCKVTAMGKGSFHTPSPVSKVRMPFCAHELDGSSLASALLFNGGQEEHINPPRFNVLSGENP